MIGTPWPLVLAPGHHAAALFVDVVCFEEAYAAVTPALDRVVAYLPVLRRCGAAYLTRVFSL
jgi:hypothetical protein